MGGFISKRSEPICSDVYKNVLRQYEGSCDWLNDEKFLKDLESDSVDTELLEEELKSFQSYRPPNKLAKCRRKTRKFLEHSLLQLVLSVFVLIDAGVVIGEILVELHTARVHYQEAIGDLHLAMDFLRQRFVDDLDEYDGDNIHEILYRLQEPTNDTFSDNTAPNSTSSVGGSNETVSPSQVPAASARRNGSILDDYALEINDVREYDESSDIRNSSRTIDSGMSGTAQIDFTKQSTSGGKFLKNASLAGSNETKVLTSYPLHLRDAHHKIDAEAEQMEKLTHILHQCSIAILGIFVVQAFVKLFAMGSEFFTKKMEIFDAAVVIASFILDLVFIEGAGVGIEGQEALFLVVAFLVWRLLRIVNGIMLTSKKRHEFRIKLQRRARRRLEKKIESLFDVIDWHEREESSLRGLLIHKGATDDELKACKPRRRSSNAPVASQSTLSGLSSIASLTLGLSMSIHGTPRNAMMLPISPALASSHHVPLYTSSGAKQRRASWASMYRTRLPSVFNIEVVTTDPDDAKQAYGSSCSSGTLEKLTEEEQSRRASPTEEECDIEHNSVSIPIAI